MVPCPENFMETMIKKLSAFVDVGFKYSGLVSFFEIGTFASKFYPDVKPVFKFLGMFDKIVWSMIIISIIVLSIISSVNQKIKIQEFIWNYFELLFSRSIQKRIGKNARKLCLGVWLVSTFYLSTVFTSQLLDYMITAVPIIK